MATKTEINNFINTLSALAVAEAKKRTRWVLPSVCIAQAALETGWGTSALMKKANAYFGIKAAGWTGKVFNATTLECYDGKTYTNVNACFRAYDCVADSVADYFDLITNNARYAGAVNNKDYKAAITAIKNGGYATDPTYVDKIVSIIGSCGLTRYDDLSKAFNGELSGNDKSRGADELVLYFKGNGKGSTGTNEWGFEVAIDKNGVVLEEPHYSGNTRIPEGGKVLSGHGKAGEWIFASIDRGDLVWFEDGRTHIAKGIHRSVDTFNGIRGADQLSVYNKGKNATTNEWGCEVAVNKNGKADSPVYGVGKMAIPDGGFVLSGHGEACRWILANVTKGNTVTLHQNVVKISR